jgi:hypothetical protein
MMSAKQTKIADTVAVYSILPHELIVQWVEKLTHGDSFTMVNRELMIRSGDNDLDAALWAKAKERSSVKRRLEDGYLSEGRIIKAPRVMRDRVWTGERNEQGQPILTPAGTDWTAQLSPKAQSVTDNKVNALRGSGVFILSDQELAGLR